MADLVLYFAGDGQLFEDHGISNGGRYWLATHFMRMLGYESMQAFEQAINRAIGTCTTLGIAVFENFEQCESEISGERVPDYKLSRFACYLVSMNGDVRETPGCPGASVFRDLGRSRTEVHTICARC